ncbi:MAG TPA: GNAT family N-acetyltransferase [Stellaceae bacterium]|nr:GNAT family N-acetyltransferase [Stellaceae bacterium]
MTPDALVFRRAASGDLQAIVALLADDPIGRSRESPGTPAEGAYRDAFAAIDRDPNQLLAVAERGGRAIGVLQLTFIPGLTRRGMWRGQIEGVRVAAGERGSGIGRAMLEWAVAECRKRGCGLVQLTSDKRRAEAHRFYLARGFQATHEGYKLVL